MLTDRTKKMLREILPWGEPTEITVPITTEPIDPIDAHQAEHLRDLTKAANYVIRSFDGKYTKLTQVQRAMMEELERVLREG